jgi:hypothetical protein
MNKQYLYDGVYASDDGFHIILEAGENTIYLEGYAFDLFLKYVEKVRSVKITVEKVKKESA